MTRNTDRAQCARTTDPCNKASLGATLLHGLGNVHPFAQGHALIAFREIYNTTWLIERHGIRAE